MYTSCSFTSFTTLILVDASGREDDELDTARRVMAEAKVRPQLALPHRQTQASARLYSRNFISTNPLCETM